MKCAERRPEGRHRWRERERERERERTFFLHFARWMSSWEYKGERESKNIGSYTGSSAGRRVEGLVWKHSCLKTQFLFRWISCSQIVSPRQTQTKEARCLFQVQQGTLQYKLQHKLTPTARIQFWDRTSKMAANDTPLAVSAIHSVLRIYRKRGPRIVCILGVQRGCYPTKRILPYIIKKKNSSTREVERHLVERTKQYTASSLSLFQV